MRVILLLLAVCLLLVGAYALREHIYASPPRDALRVAATELPPTPASGPAVRRPAVAGAFYPDDPQELAAMVDGFMARAGTPELPGSLVGLICPHAGYVYSGPVAGFSYAALKAVANRPRTVVVVGGSHRRSFAGAAITESEAWVTPLGNVRIDQTLGERLLAADARFVRSDALMAGEHSIEVQFPFLQRSVPDAMVLPIQVADFSPQNCAAVARALVAVVDPASTVLIASTDLTHYPAYEEACRTDRKTLELLTQWRLQGLREWEEEAPASGVPELHCALCGLGPVLIVMEAARQMGANVARVLKYANSGDVPAGDKSRCVGYAAVALCHVEGKPANPGEPLETTPNTGGREHKMQTSEGELNQEQQEYLLDLARRTINEWVTKRQKVVPERRDGILGEKRAVFVTIREFGHLRGCIGTLEPQEALVDAVVSRAIAAATQDPRFDPVTPEELPRLKLHISVLSPVRRIRDASEIEIGKHGVIVSQGMRRGVFLPEVALDQGWDRETMLRYLCTEKAGLPADAWKKGATLEVFTTQSFGDAE